MRAARFRAGVALTLAMAVVASTLIVVACGGNGGDEARQVDVALSEWSVTPSTVAVEEGSVRFFATNGGTEAHELVVIKSDLPPGMLPVDGGGIALERVNVEASVGAFEPGETREVMVDLSPGKYLLVCNLSGDGESHYANGMVASFLVNPAE